MIVCTCVTIGGLEVDRHIHVRIYMYICVCICLCVFYVPIVCHYRTALT